MFLTGFEKSTNPELVKDYNDVAVRLLGHRLSRKYLVCSYDLKDDKWRYMPIETGMLIQVGIKKGKYLEVVPFSWDNNNMSYYYYALQMVMGENIWISPLITAQSLGLAKAILNFEQDKDNEDVEFNPDKL